ncbi:MAG: hypothetical protein ACK48M_09025, partial [Planctomycetia bacterium]
MPSRFVLPLLAAIALVVAAAPLQACPFCGVVGQSLAQRRDDECDRGKQGENKTRGHGGGGSGVDETGTEAC